MVTNLQMEPRGTGVRASIFTPGPTMTSMGWNLPPETIGAALEDWSKWARPATTTSCARRTWPAIAFVAETPRGGFIASIEVQPEAPVGRPEGTSAAEVSGGLENP